MTYNIFTNDAKKVIKTIFDCVNKGEDPQGTCIKTWDIKLTGENEKVLVHTAKTFDADEQQWADKGCLSLTPNIDNDKITVKFHYWSSYPRDQRNDVDDKYVLGRFTELLMVHFDVQYNKVTINK